MISKCDYQKKRILYIAKLLYWILNLSYLLVGYDLVTPVGRRKRSSLHHFKVMKWEKAACSYSFSTKLYFAALSLSNDRELSHCYGLLVWLYYLVLFIILVGEFFWLLIQVTQVLALKIYAWCSRWQITPDDKPMLQVLSNLCPPTNQPGLWN